MKLAWLHREKLNRYVAAYPSGKNAYDGAVYDRIAGYRARSCTGY